MKKMKKKPAYEGFYNLHVKPRLDVIISLLFVILTLPIFVVACIAIVLEDGFPIFYCAERGGYRGKPFKIWKFRTMVKNADKIGGETTAQHDPRITKVGQILRKTKMDEIPQFWQILISNGRVMSICGPRPETLSYSNYSGRLKKILMVRPGITDFSSLKLINLDEVVGSENADEMYEKYVLPKKNKMRLMYAEHVSFLTDLWIFVATVFSVLDKIKGYLFEHKHH